MLVTPIEKQTTQTHLICCSKMVLIWIHNKLYPLANLVASVSQPFTPLILTLTHKQQTILENIVGKEEIARNEQFLLFPQCFLLNQIIVAYLPIFLTSYFNLLLNWKSPKLAYEVKG